MSNVDESPPESGEIRETISQKKKKTIKDAAYYAGLKTKYEEYVMGTDFITIPEALNAVMTRKISLLTSEVKSRKLIGVSREMMEEALKTLNVAPRMLARRSNALWDILLADEEEAKKLAGSILMTKNVRMQTEYMGTRKTRVTVHGVPARY